VKDFVISFDLHALPIPISTFYEESKARLKYEINGSSQFSLEGRQWEGSHCGSSFQGKAIVPNPEFA